MSTILRDYSKSFRYLEKSKKFISGASTFSKLNHFGEGKTPFAVTKGDLLTRLSYLRDTAERFIFLSLSFMLLNPPTAHNH